MNIPRMRHPNQTTCICRVKTENCIMAGPGQRPPIPHPSPKQKAPSISLQSITALVGLNNLFPKIDIFLNSK